jgi:hypothetical protein
MLRSLFLLITSLGVVGCGDDSCGPGDAPDTGLLASSADVTLNFGNIEAGRNNDCVDPAAPEGVISLTLQGTQVGGTGRITLCVGRPDLWETQALPLGGTSIQIVDLRGDADGCTYDYEPSRPPTGSIATKGMCDAGQGADGFEMIANGIVSFNRVCPTVTDTISVSFAGTVAVTSIP